MAGIASLPVYCRIVCPALAARPCLSYHPAGQKERRPLCLLAGEFTGVAFIGRVARRPRPNPHKRPADSGRQAFCAAEYTNCPFCGSALVLYAGCAAKQATLCGRQPNRGHPPARRRFFLIFQVFRIGFAFAWFIHKIIDGKGPPDQCKNGVHCPDNVGRCHEIEPDEKGRAEQCPAHGK